MNRFKLVCNNCGCSDCSIEPYSEPYWDDGYVLACPACGQKTNDLEDPHWTVELAEGIALEAEYASLKDKTIKRRYFAHGVDIL